VPLTIHNQMAANSNNDQLMWNPDNVKDVAESVGISSLNPETVRTVSQEVEYRLGQVINEALRFMHHSKRTILGTQDISQALACLNVEPLYGYESTRPLRFGEASLGPGQPLFYIEDEEVDFEKLINAPLPKVPRDMTFTAHWLAVAGVQPSIPQNPTTAEARATELVAKGPGANQSLGAFAGNDNTVFKPLVKHIISKELMLFFNKIVAALIDESPEPETDTYREAALDSVRTENGLHNLVPYFIAYINEKITHCISNLHILHQMMRLTNALLENKSLHLTPYATAMCPSAMTCLIGPKLGPSSNEPLTVKLTYDLRLLAASILGRIVKRYGKETNGLQARLVRTCYKTWTDMDKTLQQHYGAITGIWQIGGPEFVREIMIAGIRTYEYCLTRVQKWASEGRDAAVNEFNVQMVIEALVSDISSLSDGSSTGEVNGEVDEGPAVVEALGPLVGNRIAKLNDHKLNQIIFEAIREDELERERLRKQEKRP
jgi:transcription initiation factor TFIID subunit 6